MKYLEIIIGGILIYNFVFYKFLGICPFLGVSKRMETAIGMSMAVIFVMTCASAIAYLVHHFILIPLKLEFLHIVAFILVIATFVQFVETVIKKTNPALYRALGIYLPLITTNCAVLGVAVINMREMHNFLQSVINGFSSALGFSLALLLFSSIRERLEFSDIPKNLKGTPIALISAGLASLSFFGFQGLFRTLFLR